MKTFCYCSHWLPGLGKVEMAFKSVSRVSDCLVPGHQGCLSRREQQTQVLWCLGWLNMVPSWSGMHPLIHVILIPDTDSYALRNQVWECLDINLSVTLFFLRKLLLCEDELFRIMPFFAFIWLSDTARARKAKDLDWWWCEELGRKNIKQLVSFRSGNINA